MEKKITRRDLLKALIAGSGGIVAAGFVPEKWLKPVVKSGVLPVHAQASTPEPTASPEPTRQPTQTPTPDYIQGDYNEGDGYYLAFAYVSSQPFPPIEKDAKKLSSIMGGIDFPVEGKDVTLFVIYNDEEKVEISTKKTDVNGYVSWNLEWSNPQGKLQSINPGSGATLRFEMIDGFDEVIIPAWT